MSKINVAGSVELYCQKCKKKFVIDKSEIDFELQQREERAMGPENFFSADYIFNCDCNNEISLGMEIWEYPEGVLNHGPEYEVKGAKRKGEFVVSITI